MGNFLSDWVTLNIYRKSGANPIKHLHVEIPCILGINTTSEILLMGFYSCFKGNFCQKYVLICFIELVLAKLK